MEAFQQPQNTEAIIMGIYGEIYSMGGNDAEKSIIEDILKRFKSGGLTAEEAIQKVYEIKNSKQAYH